MSSKWCDFGGISNKRADERTRLPGYMRGGPAWIATVTGGGRLSSIAMQKALDYPCDGL